MEEERWTETEPERPEIEALLNEPQAKAALHAEGPLLIFAGAGSGKTRVIVYRIANLVLEHKVPPYRILAVTFTNKAAGEMKSRLAELLGDALARDLWVGTFHATCAKLLRRCYDAAGLSKNFVIYDDGDQKSVMNRVFKELDVDDKRYPLRQVLGRIHAEKQEGRRASDFQPDSYFDDVIGKCFEAYDRHLRQANAVDFDDLLLAVLRLVEDEASDAGAELRRRFRHVLVDEFQDVNQVQYRLVRALSGKLGDHIPDRPINLCVVGDDDQSIYRWRGADVRVIRGFRRDFPDAKVVKLEQNYRSTKNIVRAALGVIAPSKEREPKELWTANDPGHPIHVVGCDNEHDEAAFVAEKIQERVRHGVSPRAIAVFYRTHAQSRVLEEVLRKERIPYQIIGGMRFFERAEIKDLLSYLRVVVNPKSDVDVLRVINVPSRKIGDSTIEKLVATADQEQVSLYDAIERLAESGAVGTAAKRAVLSFRDLLQGLMKEARTAPPSEVAAMAIEASGYAKMLADDDSAESESRLQNLRELVGAIADYEAEATAAGEAPSLEGYLERVSLTSDADTIEDNPKVAMMTIHAAKGLEFDTVFLTGMEEDLFPFKSQDIKSPGDIEEERRLAYVAITRARERLFVTHASRRMLFGNTRFGVPSRFLSDLPTEGVEARATASLQRARVERPSFSAPRDSGPKPAWRHPMERSDEPSRARREPEREPGERFVEREMDGEPGALRRGARVVHKTFGVGVVEGCDPGDDPIATVRFSGRGSMRIKARFLKLA